MRHNIHRESAHKLLNRWALATALTIVVVIQAALIGYVYSKPLLVAGASPFVCLYLLSCVYVKRRVVQLTKAAAAADALLPGRRLI